MLTQSKIMLIYFRPHCKKRHFPVDRVHTNWRANVHAITDNWSRYSGPSQQSSAAST